MFESKAIVTKVTPVIPPVDGECNALENVMPNIIGGTRLPEEILQLHAKGIEVNDDNEPLPEEATPAPPEPEV